MPEQHEQSIKLFIVKTFSEPLFFIQRVLPVLIILGISTLLFIFIALHALSYLSPEIKITVNDNGGMEFRLPGGNKAASFLLSPNGTDEGPWVNTGIEIKNGSEAKILASGKVTLAIHHIVKSALQKPDKLPIFPWAGPNGISKNSPSPKRLSRAQDRSRSKHLIMNDNQGKLIGIISYNKPRVRPKQSDMISIGNSRTIKPSEHNGGYLWLTVNDVWLDHETIESLIQTDPDNIKTYQSLKENNFMNAWYLDNAGSLLVVVESN